MPINNNLTQAFRNVIVKESLIDTGALLRSVRVFVTLDRDIIKINVVGKSYVKYFRTPRNLMGQFQNEPLFTQEITKYMQEMLDIKMYNIINQIPGSNTFNPQVQIFLNGR